MEKPSGASQLGTLADTLLEYSQERIEPAKLASEHVTCINSKIQTWRCAKISNIHIWRLWGNPQAEGNVKLGFHTSASLTAVS